MRPLPVLLLDDPRCEAHDQGEGHPESPARVRAIRTALKADSELWGRLRVHPARPATREELLRIHTPDYLAFAEETCLGPEASLLGPDVQVCRGSWPAALLAAGGACDAVERILRGEAFAAFANLRPPGHHARPDQAMGFCILNNAAIAAHKALAAGLKKIAIVDWDVHHGNGSQEIFWDDGRVLYISLHQSPFYPGSGSKAQKGEGKAEGLILNLPLSAGTTASAYRQAWEAQVLPALDAFEPELLLVSAGFDAHAADPLADLKLHEADYARMTQDLVQFAEKRGLKGLLSLLEGGYDLEALGASARAHVRALAKLA